ncbi:MAG: flotillin domain-containing protein, partial [Cyanobacteria bacterium J06648_11]
SLQIEQEKESAQLEQRLQVEAAIAQKEREIQEAQERESASAQRTKILQEKSVEEEEIRRKLSIQQSQIDADIELEEQQKNLKVAQALQQRESDIAEIDRQKAIQASQLLAQAEVAEAEQQTRTVQADMAIAIAAKQKESFEAEAERAQAEEAVKTAKQIEIAQRDQQLVAIAAQQDAEKERISANNVVEIDVFRRRRQAEVARQAAELEADSIRTLADANRDRSLAEAEGVAARSRARNALSNANITADLIEQIWPELSKQLPEVLQALAPQPGVIGDARIYSFPGAQNNGDGNDINKILLSTSGLKIIDSLLEEGKLGGLIDRVGELLRDRQSAAPDSIPSRPPTIEAAPSEPPAYP